MILPMVKVRILGPRPRLPAALTAVQDAGLLHLAGLPMEDSLEQVRLTPRQIRFRRHLRTMLEDIAASFDALEFRPVPPEPGPSDSCFPAWARLARRTRREAEQLASRRMALEEERALLLKYRGFFAAFETLLRRPARWTGGQAFHVVLRPGQAEALRILRRELARLLGEEFELWTHELPGGEIALLLMVPPTAVSEVERLLAEGRVQDIPVPAGYGHSLADAVPRMLERLEAIPEELRLTTVRRDQLIAERADELRRARRAVNDELAQLDALPLSGVTSHAFVLEGWLPASARPRLARALAQQVGDTVVVEEIAREQWEGEEAPVVLRNPKIFRPFELLIRMLPLPRYGSIDPTPFVAVFFPMFFGLILGDVAYGCALLLLGLVLYRRSGPETTLRSVAQIAITCAAFSVIFGFMYGELLGDLGRQWFGLRPLVFDREEAVVPFLGLAVALGLVHVLLGLSLGAASAWRRHRREAVGRGVSAVMILLILIALLAAVDVMPRRMFSPAVIALLVAFPVLIVAEGIIAPVELLSTVGNILSYARIMALGTASVMLAVVANRMVGALGSVIVGVMFALLFHLVNFALGLFSPTIHALRLHYVEFFGKFYSPGGTEYRPLARWHPTPSSRKGAGGSPKPLEKESWKPS
ncbi:MAG: V-type ATP synthase subunit I [Gemmatimonadales bacterium]